MKRSRHKREHSTSKNTEIVEDLENSIENSREINLGNWTNFIYCVLFWSLSSIIYCTLIKYAEYFNLSLPVKYIFQYQLCDLLPYNSCNSNYTNAETETEPSTSNSQNPSKLNQNLSNQEVSSLPNSNNNNQYSNIYNIDQIYSQPFSKFIFTKHFYFSIFTCYNLLQFICTVGCFLGHYQTSTIHEQLSDLKENDNNKEGKTKTTTFHKESQINKASIKLEKISVIIECCKDLNIFAAILLFFQFFHVTLVWLIIIPLIMTCVNIYREFVWKIKYKVKKKVTEIGNQVSSQIKIRMASGPVKDDEDGNETRRRAKRS